MANVLDRLRDRWEQMAPRERRLVAVLASAIAIGVAFYVALGIRNGLGSLEAKNEARRDALRALQLYRSGAAAQRSKQVEIPDKPIKLDRYVEGVIQKAGIDSPRYPQPKETKKGAFVERSFELSFNKLTVVQLKDFLEKLETGSHVVVVKELHVKRNFRDKEALDVNLVVATYYKGGKGKGKGKDKGDGDGEED